MDRMGLDQDSVIIIHMGVSAPMRRVALSEDWYD
jgi:hypothetical protein